MFLFPQFGITLILFLSFSTVCLADDENLSNTQIIQCGDVINQTDSYTISYKIEQPLENRERCIFILAIPNASKYIITPNRIIEGSGGESESGPTAGIIVGGVRQDNATMTTLNLLNTDKVTIEATMLIVTLWNNQSSTDIPDFVLHTTIETLSSESTPYTNAEFINPSIDFFYSGDKYPSNQRPEILVWVFSPKNNRFSSNGPTRRFQLSYDRISRGRWIVGTPTPSDCDNERMDFFRFTMRRQDFHGAIHGPDYFTYSKTCEETTCYKRVSTDVSFIVFRNPRKMKENERPLEFKFIYHYNFVEPE